MTSPASIVIRSGSVFLKWLITVPSSTILRRGLWSMRNFFSLQFGRWRLKEIYVVLFEMRVFSNSSIAQIPGPNNTPLFLLVLWPHCHPWKLSIMLLLLSSPMMENTVSTFYSRLIFHKGMGAWMGLETYHASQGGRHLHSIICVKRIITFDAVHHMHLKSNASNPLAAHWQINSNSLMSSTSQFLQVSFFPYILIDSWGSRRFWQYSP